MFIPTQDDLSEIAPQRAADSNLGYPLAVKLVSSDIPHKSEHGAIILNIENKSALSIGISKMLNTIQTSAPRAHIEGVLLQEMVSGLGEAIIGLRRDNLVGPIITVGAGGVFTEIYQDISLRPAPVTLATAHEMIAEVKGFIGLKGYRGGPYTDFEKLAQAITAISQFSQFDQIIEAEINPLIICENKVVMVDALIRIAAPA